MYSPEMNLFKRNNKKNNSSYVKILKPTIKILVSMIFLTSLMILILMSSNNDIRIKINSFSFIYLLMVLISITLMAIYTMI